MGDRRTARTHKYHPPAEYVQEMVDEGEHLLIHPFAAVDTRSGLQFGGLAVTSVLMGSLPSPWAQ